MEVLKVKLKIFLEVVEIVREFDVFFVCGNKFILSEYIIEQGFINKFGELVSKLVGNFGISIFIGK